VPDVAGIDIAADDVYFGGLTLEEASEVLGVSVATVKRDWTLARAWLFDRLRQNQPRKQCPSIAIACTRRSQGCLAIRRPSVRFASGSSAGPRGKSWRSPASTLLITIRRRKIYALEPNREMVRMAERQRRRTDLDIEFPGRPGERIPLEDDSVDTVVSTFTLCTIPGVLEALRGVERYLAKFPRAWTHCWWGTAAPIRKVAPPVAV
jgi:ECF sigma factor/methyltransferase family protein